MAANAWKAMLPVGEGGEGASTALDAWTTNLATRTPYVLGSGEDTQNIDLALIKVLVLGSNHYFYDSTDTTTPHDGITVLVDQNGRRYKLTSVKRISSVLDITGTPPGSPTAGDTYLVDTGATGDWAGHDDDLTVYTAAGWLFVAPIPGGSVYVEDEEAYYHYTAAGSWLPGLGTLSLSADTVTPVENRFWGGMAVEAVQDAPPGSPTEHQAWLVGTSPSGAFVGHNDELAYWRNSEWNFEAPYEGAKVWDKANDQILTYNGTWDEPAEIHPIETEVVDLGGASSVDVLDLGDYVKIDVVASVSGQTLRLRFSTDNGGTFKDGAADYFNASTSGTAAFINATSTGVTSASGFNKSSIRTMVFNSAGNSYRQVAEANNAMRLFSTGGAFDAGSKVMLLKYRG